MSGLLHFEGPWTEMTALDFTELFSSLRPGTLSKQDQQSKYYTNKCLDPGGRKNIWSFVDIWAQRKCEAFKNITNSSAFTVYQDNL